MTAYQAAYERVQAAKIAWVQYEEKISTVANCVVATIMQHARTKEEIVAFVAPPEREHLRKVTVGTGRVLVDSEGAVHARVRITFGAPAPADRTHAEIDVVIRVGNEAAESSAAIVSDGAEGTAFPLQREGAAFTAAVMKAAADQAISKILPKNCR